MLTIVTWNNWKYRQISSLLEEVISCKQENIDLIEPQSNNMLFVSRNKAQQAFDMVWWPVVVDDSGIYFAAYPNFPGVFSKYMFETLWIQGLQRLFIGQPDTRARYQCVLSYMDDTLTEPKQFVGTVHGTVNFSFLDQVQINPHLPFDAFFVPEWMEVVAALDMEHFQDTHHRAKATKLCKEWLVVRK